jgi:hypothetical protein
VFGVLTLAFGDARDALFLGIVVANAAIGIVQETRAKRTPADSREPLGGLALGQPGQGRRACDRRGHA